MNHFTRDEFVTYDSDGNKTWWYEFYNQVVLEWLDDFREEWGRPVYLSPAEGAQGRYSGFHASSRHNIDHWGEIFAVDCFPEGMTTQAEVKRAVKIAEKVGFNGVGIYADTSFKSQPHPMIHLDRRASYARWGRVKEPKGRRYTPIDTAINRIPA